MNTTKKIFSIILSVIVLFGVISGMSSTAFAAETTTVHIIGTYQQTEARSMLATVNRFRTGGDAWYWNSDNKTKTTCKNLKAYTYDYDLERIAMQRAAELAASFSHTRPDGTICFTAYTTTGYNYGENIAVGYASAEGAFTGWREENKDYANQGHRRSMLSSGFTAIGIAHFVSNGVHYWVQEFRNPVKDTKVTTASNTQTTVPVKILTANITATSVKLSKSSVTLEENNSVDLPNAVCLLTVKNELKNTSKAAVTSTPTWRVEDTSVASVSNGKICAKKAGTTKATVTCTCGNFKATGTVTINVTGCSHNYKSVVTAPTCTAKGYTTKTCTKCGSQSVDSYTNAIGHKWNNGVITKAATEGKTGVKTYTCTVCKATKTETIPALPAQEDNSYTVYHFRADVNKPIEIEKNVGGYTENGKYYYYLQKYDRYFSKGDAIIIELRNSSGQIKTQTYTFNGSAFVNADGKELICDFSEEECEINEKNPTVPFSVGALGNLDIPVKLVTPREGWHIIDNRSPMKYYVKNGKQVYGWLTLDGKQYYFPKEGYHAGYMCYMENRMIDGVMYSFDENGVLETDDADCGVYTLDFTKSKSLTVTHDVMDAVRNTLRSYCGEALVSEADLNRDGKTDIVVEVCDDNLRYGIIRLADTCYADSNFTIKVPKNTHCTQPYYSQINVILNHNQTQNSTVKNGWVTENGKKHYYKNGKSLLYRQKIGGKLYYFNGKGELQIGWIKGKECFYADKNGVLKTGWQKIGGKQYLFAYADGHMIKGWYTSGKNKFYFNNNGVMLTGWQKIGGKQYLFAYADGHMIKGWYTSGKKKFYFNSNGVMLTESQMINGLKYYFDKNGVLK